MILLDTHAVLWLTLEPNRLPRKVTALLAEARLRTEYIAVSAISLIETANAIARGRIDSHVGLEAFLTELEARFTVLPITAAVAAASTRLPESYPRDPADRIIGATALIHGAALVTADQRIRKIKAVRTIW